MTCTPTTKLIYSTCLAAVLIALVLVGGEIGLFEENSTVDQLHETIRSVVVPRSNWDREDTISCMLKYVDGLRETKDSRGHTVYVLDSTKKDGCIDDNEISNAKKAYLSSFERGIGWVAKETNEKIMRKCNYDMKEEDNAGKPHCISQLDMQLSNKTCLATQDRLEKMNTYICRRAQSRFD